MVSEYPEVDVIGAPGFEDFRGELIMELPSPIEMMSVVGDPVTKHVDVVPSRFVHEVAE